jgi:hypothetical protein
MTTTYHIVHNNEHIDQDVSIEALFLRLKILAEANPTNRYNITIEGPGNPAPQPTDTTPT